MTATVTDTGGVAITVVLVDDHAGFRQSARRLLTAAGYHEVGEAANGADAVAVTRDLDPDLVLLDVLLPDRTGFDVVDDLVTQNDRPIVVLTSSRSATDFATRLETSTAKAFISKSDLTAHALAQAIRC